VGGECGLQLFPVGVVDFDVEVFWSFSEEPVPDGASDDEAFGDLLDDVL